MSFLFFNLVFSLLLFVFEFCLSLLYSPLNILDELFEVSEVSFSELVVLDFFSVGVCNSVFNFVEVALGGRDLLEIGLVGASEMAELR